MRGCRVPAIPRRCLWGNGIGAPGGSADLRRDRGEGDPVSIDLEPSWTHLCDQAAERQPKRLSPQVRAPEAAPKGYVQTEHTSGKAVVTTT